MGVYYLGWNYDSYADIQMTKDEFLERVKEIHILSFNTKEDIENWYFHYQFDLFGNKTSEQMVDEGRANDLLRYLESLTAGFLG
jgi:hypothetical protein